MYHCHILFYFVGRDKQLFELLKAIPPLENFTHEFTQSQTPEKEFAVNADVIIADVREMDADSAIKLLLSWKKQNAELTIIADDEQSCGLFKHSYDVIDIWTLPMADDEIRFYFLRRQWSYKQKIDLRQTGQYLEALFTTMDCGVMCHTLDGSRIISINQAALDILGYKSLEDLKKDGFLLVAPSVLDEDKPKLMESIKAIKNVDDSSSLEYRVMHENGDIRHVFGSVKLMEKDGELYYQRFLLDRTAQKLLEEEELEKDKRQHMELVHALSADYNIVCYFDLDTGKGRVLRRDKCKKNLLEPIFNGELCLKECMERYIEMGVHDEDKELLRRTVSKEYLEETLSQKSACHTNYRMTCCDDKIYFQMKAVRAGKWNHSRGVVLGIRNIDEETRSEREKKELLESALSQANRANKAKSTFLSNMSHDIRTPMNAIIGFTSLAITHIDNKEQVEKYLKKIMSSGNHLLSLINDVLDMSRIESGKIHLDEDVCSLPGIMHELRNIIQADIKAKKLDLHMEAVDIAHEEIFCDRLRLKQVLINLLSNAMKYTDAGGAITMTLVEKAGAAKGYANYEFTIKDTGIGMSEEFVARIFEPFERERNSTISGIQGTGLGMAITKSIIDMMNGSIEVKSSKDSGTECIVRLTCRVTVENNEPQVIPELEGFKALLVDDDINACGNISHMLTDMGLKADCVMSGKDAVLRSRQANMSGEMYSVYIIDWSLLDMNGLEAAQKIQLENGRDIPVIILTPHDWTDIEEEAGKAGVKAFCSKPLFMSELRECLYSIFNDVKNANAEEAEKETLRAGRILLAEDNELNQEIAVALLGEAGFSIDVAQNGQEAVEMLENSKPGYYQIVLMDIQMPVMNGYEAAKKIRSLDNEELASIPIIAMTANAFEEDKKEALNSGMDGHIAKPVDVVLLLEMLDEMFEKEIQELAVMPWQ